MRIYYLLLLFISFVVSSCDQHAGKSKSGTYIGGEIINPTSDQVKIYKENEYIASVNLESDNSFLYKFENFIPGVYKVLHNEYQYVYIQQDDSLLIRLNTIEFDETISFSGYGAMENNFLMKLFLLNEQENDFMLREKIYKKDPRSFLETVDSLKQVREIIWDEFKFDHVLNEYYKDLIEAINNYDFYARKEVYPLSYFESGINNLLGQLPQDFYTYREQANFNSEKYLSTFGYKRFLWNYFNQQAYLQYSDEQGYEPNSFTHNLHKLRLIDTEISNDSVSSYLLSRTMRNYLANSNDKTGGDVLYDLYSKKIASTFHKQEIQRLYESNKNIETGKTIPDEKVITFNNDTLRITQLISKPTFIFFWSRNNKNHHIRAHKRAKELIQQHPKFQYLAINVDDNYKAQWKQAVNRYGYDKSREIQFKDAYEKISKDLAITSIVKTFIIDANGRILNSHANIFGTYFEKELEKALSN